MTHEQLEAISLGADESLRRYLDDIRSIPMLSREEEIELAQQARKGDAEARARLVKSNLRFVVSIAKRYQHRGLSLVDLIADGNLGLVRAVDRFDETLGYKFISYAVWWIRQAIIQALCKQARPMRVPSGRMNVLFRLEREQGRMEQRRSASVHWTDLAEELHESDGDMEDMLILNPRVASFDGRSSDEEPRLSDILGDEKAVIPDREFEQRSCRREVALALAALDERERTILCKFFGLGMDERQTLEEIGNEYRLTRERIRQIKDRALRKLRHFSRSQSLREYLTA